MLATLNLCFSLPLLLIVAMMQRNWRSAVGGTTLVHSWFWMMLALTVWVAVQILALDAVGLSAGWQSRIGYFASTLLFAPFVSVLGAKRPGSRVWDWFIVLPMIVVLNWPVIAASVSDLPEHTLDLEGPALMGALVVLVMILGNYFGTMFTPLALLLGGSLLCGLTEYSGILPRLGDGHFVPRMIVSAGLLIALLLAPVMYQRQLPHRSGYQRVWLDFRDWFGVLWTKRVMDRLNQTAEAKQWPVRFGLDGIAWQEESALDSQHDAEIEHTLRWLFRRFTNDEWIDRRLKNEVNEIERDNSS
jgi:hypothetical protein